MNTRRDLLKGLGLTLAGTLLGGSQAVASNQEKPRRHPTFPWVNQTDGPRPQFVWKNCEDMMYHDTSFWSEELQRAPEFFPFLFRVWVFNRAMQWHRNNDETIIVNSTHSPLLLTGQHQVSTWHSDPDNTHEEVGDFTVFTKKSPLRRRECTVLPALQIHIHQHPILELTVEDATCDWQFCIAIKGRSGIPFLSSAWQRGAGTFRVNIKEELDKLGYTLNYAELHFVMGLWGNEATSKEQIKFKVQLIPAPVIIACLPVVRALKEGIVTAPITAIVFDKSSVALTSTNIKLYIKNEQKEYTFNENNGIWSVAIPFTKTGNYTIQITSSLGIQGTVQVRITDGKYMRYDKKRHLLYKEGEKIKGPLTGSYQGIFYFNNIGLKNEDLVQGSSDWNTFQYVERSDADSNHLHYWEALTENELHTRFAYLQSCGWDLLHLNQHWSFWERLDAGGFIAPHGAEQLALYIRTADQYGLKHEQSLTHYPYAFAPTNKDIFGCTPAYIQYKEAGYKDEDWYNINAEPFKTLFHNYLNDFTNLFAEETAIAALCASGEGDSANGLARSMDIFNFVRSKDANHLFLGEPVLSFATAPKLPEVYNQGWTQDLLGSRTYDIGNDVFPEIDLALYFQFNRMEHMYMAEGNWPYPNLHTKFFMGPEKEEFQSWVATEIYKTRLRDTLYLGLVFCSPIILTWEEQVFEDEHIVFHEVCKLINWEQNVAEAKVALLVSGVHAVQPQKNVVADYEKAFSILGIPYTQVRSKAEAKGKFLIDAHKPFVTPKFKSEGGQLPDYIKQEQGLIIKGSYATNLAWSEGKNTLMAYCYNIKNHSKRHVMLGGDYHRTPEPSNLSITIQNLASSNLTLRIYSLNEKKVIKEMKAYNGFEWSIEATTDDYFILIN